MRWWRVAGAKVGFSGSGFRIDEAGLNSAFVPMAVVVEVAVVGVLGAGDEPGIVGKGSTFSGLSPSVWGEAFLEPSGPSGISSARRLARSTFSRKLMAASRFVKQ